MPSFKPSLVKSGRQPGAKMCRREWTTVCAAFCVRGPRWSTGRIFVQGSMTSQSHSTWEQLRSLVRSSSNCRCGRWSWKKKRSCRVCACSPARDSQVVMVACRKPKTREAAEGSSPSARAESTWATCWEGVFSRYKGVLRLEVNVVRHA